jgi:hypothetical protein
MYSVPRESHKTVVMKPVATAGNNNSFIIKEVGRPLNVRCRRIP